MVSGGVRDKTINGDLIILRAVLNHAVAAGLLPELLFKIRLLKVAKKRQRKVFSREELRQAPERARWGGGPPCVSQRISYVALGPVSERPEPLG